MKAVQNMLVPDQEVIRLLNNMLQEAESGRLRSIAIAGVLTSSETCNGWAGCYYPVSLIGELVVVQREIIDALVDLSSKPAGAGYIYPG